MSLARVAAIAKQDLRILRTDLMAVVPIIVLPLLVMPFLKPAFRLALHLDGLHGATGAEQVVPGMAVTFGFFLAANVCGGLFREHAWKTWDRLRVSPASTAEIMAGKLVTPLIEVVLQFSLLFGVGGLLMNLQVKGSWPELCVVGLAFGLYLVATGLAITALCRSFMQANAIVTVGALLSGAFAGALVPYSLLPAWAQTIAPAVPSYWAMQGYRRVILAEGGHVWGPVLVLLAFAAAAGAIALTRFRFDSVKVGPT